SVAVAGAGTTTTLANVQAALNAIPALVGNFTAFGGAGGPFIIVFNNAQTGRASRRETATFATNTATPGTLSDGIGNEVQTLAVSGANAGQTLTLAFAGVNGSVAVAGAGTTTTLANVQAALNAIPALVGNFTALGGAGGPFIIVFNNA